jgi:hypothetical protein
VIGPDVLRVSVKLKLKMPSQIGPTLKMKVLTSFYIVNGPSGIKNVCHVVFQSSHTTYSTFTLKKFSILFSFDIDISEISI